LTEPARLSQVTSSDIDQTPARQEAIDLARYLARRRVRAMMVDQINDSAPRKK